MPRRSTSARAESQSASNFAVFLGGNQLPDYRGNWRAGVAELVDATDLAKGLSARGEIRDVELLKVGETSNVAIPSQAPLGKV